MAPWECFLVIGAALLILGDVVFGIVLREFYAGDVIWLVSAVALLPSVPTDGVQVQRPSPDVVMLLAAAAVVVSVSRRPDRGVLRPA